MGTRLELKTGGLYEVSADASYNGVMTYINGEEVSADVFRTASAAWDKYIEVPTAGGTE